MANKIEKKMESMQKSAARKRLVEALENQNTLSAVVGTVAGTAGAAVTAVIDGKYARSPSDMATFGQSPIPIAPTIGAGFIVAGVVAYMFDAPVVGAGLTQFGMRPVDIALYQGIRNIWA